jgi:hypothetical protein
MREIELVLNPISAMEPPTASLGSFGTGSWVELLVSTVAEVVVRN